MELTRREFLIAGTAAGAIPACALSLPQVIYAGANDGASEPLERTVRTLCRRVPDVSPYEPAMPGRVWSPGTDRQ